MKIDQRKRQDRLKKRLDRLDFVAPPPPADQRLHVAGKARTALRRIHESAAVPPAAISVRQSFVRLAVPLGRDVVAENQLGKMEGRTRAEKPIPPLAKLISPRGLALQMELIALFVAQATKARRNGQVDLPLPLEGDHQQIGWIELAVAHATFNDASELSVQRRGNRLRQVKAALDVLASPAVGLIGLPNAGARSGKYANLQLMHEGGARDTGDPLPYRVLDASEPAQSIPADFWLNGWVHVMTDSEIAAWLMFRDAATAPDLYPPPAADGSFVVTGSFRLRHYCLTKETWNSYRMLERFGLLHVIRAPGRRTNGTYEDFDPSSSDRPPPHSFVITDGALKNDATFAVRAAVAAARDDD